MLYIIYVIYNIYNLYNLYYIYMSLPWVEHDKETEASRVSVT